MKKGGIVFVLLFCIFQVSQLVAQTQVRPHRCGTVRLMEQYFKKNPGARVAFLEERKRIALRQSQLRSLSNMRLSEVTTLTLPVVVHIVLENPADISDQQVFSQIEALNTDFAGLNPDGKNVPVAFKSTFGNCRIRFCLAQRTPQGKATNGIIRKTSSVLSAGESGDPIKYSKLLTNPLSANGKSRLGIVE